MSAAACQHKIKVWNSKTRSHFAGRRRGGAAVRADAGAPADVVHGGRAGSVCERPASGACSGADLQVSMLWQDVELRSGTRLRARGIRLASLLPCLLHTQTLALQQQQQQRHVCRLLDLPHSVADAYRALWRSRAALQPADLFGSRHVPHWSPALALYAPLGCALAALRMALWIALLAVDQPALSNSDPLIRCARRVRSTRHMLD